MPNIKVGDVVKVKDKLFLALPDNRLIAFVQIKEVGSDYKIVSMTIGTQHEFEVVGSLDLDKIEEMFKIYFEEFKGEDTTKELHQIICDSLRQGLKTLNESNGINMGSIK